MEQRKITIGHLYPDLLNLYGDRGNIACMMQRCIWRGIEAETKEFNLGDKIDFSEVDIVLLGGGSDREQMIVCQKLQEIQSDFKEYVEDGGVVIAVCGGYQLLGKYYKTEEGVIQGLDLVDLYTEQGEGRLLTISYCRAIWYRCRWSDLRIMADVLILMVISHLVRCYMDPVMMVRVVMNEWFIRM